MKSKTLLLLFFALPLGTYSQTTDVPMVHDPVMAYENGCYYLFSTGHNIQLMTSSDMKSWDFHREGALNTIPSWTKDSVPGFTSHIWAPDVISWHGKWWMAYSCSTFGKNTSAIGLASTSSLSAFHWDDMGCVIKSHKGDKFNAIDPNFVIDDNDDLWMTFGSFWDGIQLVKLKSVKQKFNDGEDAISWLKGSDERLVIDSSFQQKTIARRYGSAKPTDVENPTSRYAGTNAIEAPFIFRHAGWYYLFVSWDYCCRGEKSTYKVVVGRSKSLLEPFVDRDGKEMCDGGGTLVIEGDKKVFEAAGHSAAYHINNSDLFICHGYSIAKNGQSVLVKRQMAWDKDGWPVLKEE